MSTFQTLYRKWRPLDFTDVMGQSHITDTLKNEIKFGRIAQAYLFCGTRGTGKTTVAKIFSRAVNCLDPQGNGDPCNKCDNCKLIISGTTLDVLEIDAASNNGVDNIRDIREEAIYAPTAVKYRVYIIDEAHMLSTSAFNALLKILEEPPAHVVFILATTELQKIPATVRSRCQRFEFKRILINEIVQRLKTICESDSIMADDDALHKIAALSDGSLRDALSLLEQCRSVTNKVGLEEVLAICGEADSEVLFSLVDDIINGNVARVLDKLNEILEAGKDMAVLVESAIQHFRQILAICSGAKYSDKDREHLSRQAKLVSVSQVIYILGELSNTFLAIKMAKNPRVILECGLIKLCDPHFSNTDESVLARLDRLESADKPKNNTLVENSVEKENGIMESSKKLTNESKETTESKNESVEKKQEISEETTITEVLQKSDINISNGKENQMNANELLERLKNTEAPYRHCLNGATAKIDGEKLMIIQPRQVFYNMLINSADEMSGIINIKIGIEKKERTTLTEAIKTAESVNPVKKEVSKQQIADESAIQMNDSIDIDPLDVLADKLGDKYIVID